ncbi:MAG: DUF922 domain-containing protein [Pseudomonadota bacterium]
MAINIATKTAKIIPYTVKGNTLADIEAFMKKNGPRDGKGKSHAAITRTAVYAGTTWQARIKEVHKRPDGEFSATVTFATLTLTIHPSIKFPKLGANTLSNPAHKEWKRYIAKLKAHELEHVTEVQKYLQALTPKILKLEGADLGKTEKEATANAAKDLGLAFKLTYMDGHMKRELEKLHKAFDDRTGHGAKHGAKLNTKIQ